MQTPGALLHYQFCWKWVQEDPLSTHRLFKTFMFKQQCDASAQLYFEAWYVKQCVENAPNRKWHLAGLSNKGCLLCTVETQLQASQSILNYETKHHFQ